MTRAMTLGFLVLLLARTSDVLRADDLAPLSDEFEDAATLALWQRIYQVEGWNANQLEVFDINTTRPGRMVMIPYTSTWFQDYRGELTFKTVTGDFVVTADVEATQRNGSGAPRSSYSLAGLMVRTPRNITPQTWTPGGENYVFLSLGSAESRGTFQFEVKSTVNSNSMLITCPSPQLACTAGSRAVLQVARIGSYVITLRQLAGGPWAVHRRYTRSDMPPTLQVGFTCYTDYPAASMLSPFAHNSTVIHTGNPDLVAAFDYIHYQRPRVPASLLGRNLSDPAAVSDADLLSFLGANVNAAPPPLLSWILPSSARAAGSGGAFYTTDLTLANAGAADATFTLKFLGNNVDGRSGVERSFSLGAGKSVTYADLLGSVFGLASGFGAVRITAPSCLVVVSQTSTPGGGGTYGQSVPAAGSGDLVAVGAPRSIAAVREDAAFRTNLVLANATEAALTVDATLVSDAGVTLAAKSYGLSPLGMTQVTRVVRDMGVSGDLVGARLVLSTATTAGTFAAYAAVIDNVTNDPRTLLPR